MNRPRTSFGALLALAMLLAGTGGALAAVNLDFHLARVPATGPLYATDTVTLQLQLKLLSVRALEPGARAAKPVDLIVYWGDGHNDTFAAQLTVNRLLKVGMNHTYTAAGSYHVNATAAVLGATFADALQLDIVKKVTRAVSSPTIDARPFPIIANEQHLFTFGGKYTETILGRDASDPLNLTLIIDWGDGSLQAPLVQALAPGADGEWFVNHTYTVNDTYTITAHLALLGLEGGDVTGAAATLAVTVRDAAPAPWLEALLLAAPGIVFKNQTHNFTIGGRLMPVGAAGVSGVPTLNLTLDWGDGSPLHTETLPAPLATLGSDTLGHMYTEASGVLGYVVKLTVTVPGVTVAAAVKTITVLVQDLPLPLPTQQLTLAIKPPATEPAAGVASAFDFLLDVAASSRRRSLLATTRYTITVDWGDGSSTSSIPLDNAPLPLNAAPNHTWAAAGTYTVRAAAHDETVVYAAGSAQLDVAVGPPPPKAGIISVTYPKYFARISPMGPTIAPSPAPAFDVKIRLWVAAGETATASASFNGELPAHTKVFTAGTSRLEDDWEFTHTPPSSATAEVVFTPVISITVGATQYDPEAGIVRKFAYKNTSMNYIYANVFTSPVTPGAAGLADLSSMAVSTEATRKRPTMSVKNGLVQAGSATITFKTQSKSSKWIASGNVFTKAKVNWAVCSGLDLCVVHVSGQFTNKVGNVKTVYKNSSALVSVYNGTTKGVGVKVWAYAAGSLVPVYQSATVASDVGIDSESMDDIVRNSVGAKDKVVISV